MGDHEELLERALKARERAYAPYSRFPVGAALRTRSGEIFIGANVENASFGLTICAERSAIVSAVAAGHREFEAIVVVADTKGPVSPCGACRQVIGEFGDVRVICADLSGATLELPIAELLPHAFRGSDLPKEQDDG